MERKWDGVEITPFTAGFLRIFINLEVLEQESQRLTACVSVCLCARVRACVRVYSLTSLPPTTTTYMYVCTRYPSPISLYTSLFTHTAHLPHCRLCHTLALTLVSVYPRSHMYESCTTSLKPRPKTHTHNGPPQLLSWHIHPCSTFLSPHFHPPPLSPQCLSFHTFFL